MAKVTVQKIHKEPDGVAVLILQWLTYALWGMFIGALMWLAGVVLGSTLVEGAGPVPGDFIAFTFATVLVSLVLAIIADYWYTRYEPVQKTGVAKVILLVHTVLYALAGVALMITVVYNLIATAVGAEDAQGERMTVLLVALTGVVGLVVLVTRILIPFRRAWLRKAAMLAMATLGVGFMLAALVGPATVARLAAQDKATEDGVEVVAETIREYANENDKLPESLKELDIQGGSSRYSGTRYYNAKKALDKDAIKYTPNTKTPTAGGAAIEEKMYYDDTATSVAPYEPGDESGQTFYYKLCVTYLVDQSKRGSYYPQDTVHVFPNTYAHGKGEQCYDLQTRYGTN